MKFISLFAGIGGFDLALTRQGHECVWVNEWDKYAAQIYDKNFNQDSQSLSEVKQNEERGDGTLNQDRSDSLLSGHSQSTGNRNNADKNFIRSIQPKDSTESKDSEYIKNQLPERQHLVDRRDIRTVPTDEIPDHDLLVGGFPCQAFSIAGKRRGFDDTRGTLFFEVARILREKQPRLFILENVKGLLSHDNGNTFKTIIATIVELGYDIQWQVLNSKNFGVPQNRERVFIIGHLRGTSRPEVFPIRENDQVYNQPDEDKEKIHDIASTMTARQFSSWNGNYIQQLNNPTHSNNRVYGKNGISPTLNTAQGGNRQPFVALTERRTEEAKRLRRLGIVKDTRNLKKLELREDGISNTVTTGDVKNQSLFNGSQIRRLTPTECERLQGFPDGWTKQGIWNNQITEISDTQRYKCLGNAVTVNVVEWIVNKLQVNK